MASNGERSLFNVVFSDSNNSDNNNNNNEGNLGVTTRSSTAERPIPTPSQSIDVHLERFASTYNDEFFTSFNRDTFKRLADEMYERLKIPENYRVVNQSLYVGAAQVPTMIVNNSNALKEHFFFKGEEGVFFSVQDDDMRKEALSRNFEQIWMPHYSTIEQMPATRRRRLLPPEDPERTTVPKDSYPPFRNGKIPSLYEKKDAGDTYAVKIVRAWEDRLIVNGIAYTPYKFWVIKDAKKEGLKESITRFAKPYVAVKKVFAGKPPVEIKDDVKILAIKATRWKQNQNNEEGWFEIAKAIAT